MLAFRLVILLIIFFSVYCSPKINQNPRAEAGNHDGSIRVMAYNIHHANPPSVPNLIDIKAIANVIKSYQPDLVALQELDVHTIRSGKSLNQAAELARLTGMNFFFAKAIDYAEGEYGVAILSRFPIERSMNHPLPTAGGTGGELRTLAVATVKLPNGKNLVFACTHLDAQGNDTNRVLQINKIIEILGKESKPVIIAGDFNATPSDKVINKLDSRFTRTCIANCGFTIPVINPTKTIDYIAFSPAAAFNVISHKVIDEKYASDHLPVVAELRFKY